MKLKRCAKSMFLSEISSNDKIVLNYLFLRIDNSIIISEHAFIKSKEVDEKTYDNTNKWLLTIKIYGLKKFESSIRIIWKIDCMQRMN